MSTYTMRDVAFAVSLARLRRRPAVVTERDGLVLVESLPTGADARVGGLWLGRPVVVRVEPQEDGE